MSGFEVGDKVVYSPHGAGVVVSKEHRNDERGEYLSIRITHSKMTLMVPDSDARSKGVRPVISAKMAKKLLSELSDEGQPLNDNPQHRAREAADKTRTGDAEKLAGILRDYTTLARSGKKLSHTEQKSLMVAKQMLSSELALANDVDINEAAEQVERALGNEE